ncbi:hypothetical protein BBAL3_1372 [Brevundimonas sp. BAL3]|jgi:hypothetical protein|nr:hypothetical protein BBAL3_1372 [Brevundimonas sp. BAL3]
MSAASGAMSLCVDFWPAGARASPDDHRIEPASAPKALNDRQMDSAVDNYYI